MDLQQEPSPTVSVALTTFNGSAHLEGQLASFLDQTRLPDELIACDDRSEDASIAVLRSFARRAPFPVKIYKNETRLGSNANFGRAIELCSGHLILLSDQDDVWLPTKIERMVDVLESNPSALVAIHDLSIVDTDLRSTGTTQLRRMKKLRIPISGHVTGSATAFRQIMRSVLLPFPIGLRTYDTWIHAVGEALGARILMPEVLSLYRRHADTETNAAAASWNLRGLIGAIRESLRRTSDVADGERLEWLSELEQRFSSLSHDQWRSLIGEEEGSVEPFLKRQRWAVMQRRAALLAPWPMRLSRVVHAYRSGAYQEFAGPGSAIRDLFTFDK